jgi:hypothetical protein
MWKDKEPHFGQDYFFKDQAFASDGKAQVSQVLGLGETLAGIRVRGWVVGSAKATSGNTIKTVLKVADAVDAEEWITVAENTVTADGTTISGDIFAYIPEADKKFMRVEVTNASGVSGAFSVAPELIP